MSTSAITNTSKTIKELNKLFLESLLDSMKAKGIETLDEELQVKLTDNGFQIFSSPDVIYANYGRNPGKLPPTKELESWAKRNNISTKALFPIAVKISKDGVEGLDFIPDFDKEIQESQEMLADSMIKDIEAVIKELQNKIKQN